MMKKLAHPPEQSLRILAEEIRTRGQEIPTHILVEAITDVADALAAQQDGVRDAAQLLVDRLEEFNVPADGEAEREWYGHVVLALERLMHALSER